MVTFGVIVQPIGAESFFSSEKVTKAIGEAKRKKLSLFGAKERGRHRLLRRLGHGAPYGVVSAPTV